MIDLITNLITLALVAMLVLWAVYAVLVRFWPSAANSQAGQVAGRITDATQDVAAKAALRAIRWMDEVDKSPAAVAAWNILYAAVGGTEVVQSKPVVPGPPLVTLTPPVAPAVSNQTVDEHADKITWTPGG